MNNVWIVSAGLNDGHVILGVYDTISKANKLVAQAEKNMTYDNHYIIDGIKYNSVIVRQYGVNNEG